MLRRGCLFIRVWCCFGGLSCGFFSLAAGFDLSLLFCLFCVSLCWVGVLLVCFMVVLVVWVRLGSLIVGVLFWGFGCSFVFVFRFLFWGLVSI